jgi:hypothetical protein
MIFQNLRIDEVRNETGRTFICAVSYPVMNPFVFKVKTLEFNGANSWSQHNMTSNANDFIIDKQKDRIESLIQQARINDEAFNLLARTINATDDLKAYCRERAERMIQNEAKVEGQKTAKA